MLEKAIRHKEDGSIADKIELTKEQLTELTEYFKQNDFTKNMMLDRKYNLKLEESKVFIKAKEFFGKYWLGILRPLGVKRTMKNFSIDYPVNFLENADADYIAQSVAEIYFDPEKLKRAIDAMFVMYKEPIKKGLIGYAAQLDKSVDDLTDDEICYVVEKVAEIAGEVGTNIESLISQLNEEQLPSGYEVEVELFQYTWDGWGISAMTVGACDVAYNIIDALKAMKKTGETVPKISDEAFEIGGGQYPVERGTMWIESGNKIYRLTPDLSQICLVETHFGEGKVLEITDAFKTNVNNAWHYAPYDYYKGTYNKGDYTVNLTSVFKSGSTVQLSIKKIQIESGYDPNNTITVELISSVDQEVNIKLHCQQSEDNLAAGDSKSVQLEKGVPTTVDLTVGGWSNFTYWVYIEADSTKAEITINP